MNALTREERIALIHRVQELRDGIEAVMEILVPPEHDDGECAHPPNAIADESSMGEPLYRCTRCGVTQDRPFTAAL